jgi:hypothetical protein
VSLIAGPEKAPYRQFAKRSVCALC